MAKVSYDGQSFSVDGQRVWLVSGAIDYLRVPRGLWRSRLRAAKQAGLNCIATDVFWNVHEPTEGEYDWGGEKDLRHFVELIGEEGMWCWLRPGPFVGAGVDNGGLPGWLHTVATDRKSGPMKVREGSAPYLGACSRYLGEVMRQVGNLQVTRPADAAAGPAKPGAGPLPGAAAGGFRGQGAGPILLMQAEHEWLCHNPDQEEGYLRQVVRYLTENGCTVPVTVCNQLWQEVDGTLHTWNASANLPADMRQLGVVQPDGPRVVGECATGTADRWGQERDGHTDAAALLYRLAGALSAGAQINLHPFHGGTNLGFTAGRTVGPAGRETAYSTTSHDGDTPLGEAGGRGEKYAATKRISTFASHFGQTFAHLDPHRQAAAIHPDGSDHPMSVVHLRGERGDVVFLLRGAADKVTSTRILLPDGLSLPVELGDEPAAWLLLDTPLPGGNTLDYTNLRPFAAFTDHGRAVLVLFGPAGTTGLLSLNDAPAEIDVPADKTPAVLDLDGVTVIVLNVAQADAAYLYKDGLAVGSNGLDDDGQPEPLKGWTTQHRVAPDGSVTPHKTSVTRKPVAPKLGPWTLAPTTAYIDGSADAYRPLKKGPLPLDRLGVPLGYGWYRVTLPGGGKAKREQVLIPDAGDRLHFFRDGKPEAFVGDGPGGNGLVPVAMTVSGTMTVLADALGRACFGQHVGEEKGIASHLFAAKPVKLPKPEITATPGPDLFQLTGYAPFQRLGERRPAQTLTFPIKPSPRQPMVLDLHGFPVPALVTVNDEPFADYLGPAACNRLRLTLDPTGDGPFTGGTNAIRLILTDPLPDGVKLADHLTLYQCTANLTAKAEWAFAPFAAPDDDAFTDAKPASGRPTWYRTTFNGRDGRCPLFLHPKGLSKGQIYLNGHNVGRYFMQTPDKKAVPPQSLYYLPEPWLHATKPNTLTLFDEHGFSSKDVELIHDDCGPYGS